MLRCNFYYFRSLHPVKYYRDYLTHSIRPDGRDLDKFRPVVLNVGTIRTADGSAIVKIGRTTVICGIKAVSTKGHCFHCILFNEIMSFRNYVLQNPRNQTRVF